MNHNSYTSKTPWSETQESLLKGFLVEKESGLSKSEALIRQATYGKNLIHEKPPVSYSEILWRQLKSIIVLLLVVASLISFLLGDYVEGFAILAVLLINTLLGFFSEVKAVRSMEALRKLGKTQCNVIRNKVLQLIDSEELVPGDILSLEAGDIIPADARVLESSKVLVDESSLTGESLPVSKDEKVLNPETVLIERKNMLFKSCYLTRGSAIALVVATGGQTQIGHIAALADAAKEEITPLERRLERLGRKLVWLTPVIGAVIILSGWLTGKSLGLMLETAVALAVATIPEGLPVVATIALAKGMWRMAKQNALINRLSAVETLGALSIIVSDKTGTLTEGVMRAREIFADKKRIRIDGESLDNDTKAILSPVFTVCGLCNNASLGKGRESGFSGDPLEVALLEAAEAYGYHKAKLLERFPEIKEVSFDPNSRMMATYHKANEGIYVAVKGAPEAVMAVCSMQLTKQGEVCLSSEDKAEYERLNNQIANEGYRVLAIAHKRIQSDNEEPYSHLTLLGLVALQDPPRTNIAKDIDMCHVAGIRVVMATGDQVGTAKAIGREIHVIEDESESQIMTGKVLEISINKSTNDLAVIKDVNVFARVSPEQKLDIVSLHQKLGSVVAVTGDGVNDAPALKKADVGIAMGIRGTQVAKEAAGVVLKDDDFTTILSSIEQGRAIFNNIRSFVVYLLSCNLSEILIIATATAMSLPLPILPIQILYLNLVTDVFPALALGMGEAEKNIMKLPPRSPKEDIVTTSHWLEIVVYCLMITATVLTVYLYVHNHSDYDESSAITAAFLTLGFTQVFHVFNMRASGANIIINKITTNPHVWGAVTLCMALMIGPLYVESIRRIMGLSSISYVDLISIIGFSLIPLILGQFYLAIKHLFKS